MRTYEEAMEYSLQHPTELAEFIYLYSNGGTMSTGSFLNGKREGLFTYYNHDNKVEQKDTYNSKTSHIERKFFWGDESLESHYFSKNNIMHGEYMQFNEDGTTGYHQFVVNDCYMEELDYLINEPRDEAFYVTLALYGIDKEYTIGG